MEERTKKMRRKRRGGGEERGAEGIKNVKGWENKLLVHYWYTIQYLYNTLLSEVSICEPL